MTDIPNKNYFWNTNTVNPNNYTYYWKENNKINNKDYYNMNYTTTLNNWKYTYKDSTSAVPYETGTIQYTPEQYGETYYEGDFYPAQVPQELSNLKPINWDEVFKKSGMLKEEKTVEEKIKELHEELDKLVAQQKDKIIEKRLRKKIKFLGFK